MMIRLVMFTSLMVICVVGQAAASSEKAWACLSFDHLKRSYLGDGNSVRTSMAAARKLCISQAPLPSRCRVSHLWCAKGKRPSMGSQCTAEDESGKRFQAEGRGACKLALKECRQWQRQLASQKRSHCAIVHG